MGNNLALKAGCGLGRKTVSRVHREVKSDELLFTETMREARVMVMLTHGVFPMEGRQSDAFYGMTLKRILLLRGGSPIRHTYCAFWKRDNGNQHIEPFARLLREQLA